MGSVARLDALFRLFGPARTELTMPEIAASLDVSLPTAYRLVNELLALGYLERTGTRGPVRLGLRLVELGRKVEAQLSIVAVADPHMRRLTEASQETSVLTVPRTNYAVAVHRIEGSSPIRPRALSVGESIPYNAGANPLTLLAHLPDEHYKRVLRSRLPRLTPSTLVDRAAIEQRCALIRQRGYDFSESEVIVGTAAVAAPIFDAGGSVVGVLSLTGLASRVSGVEDDVIAAARDASNGFGAR